MSSRTSSPDLLRLDLSGAAALRAALSDGADGLRRDAVALERVLDDAARLLGGPQGAPVVAVRTAAATLEELSSDLHRRLVVVQSLTDDAAAVDRLTASLDGFDGPPGDPARHRLEEQRYELVLGLVGGDERLAIRVVGALAGSRDLVHAVQKVQRRVAREARIDAAMFELGIDVDEATAMVDRLDSSIGHLVLQGFPEPDAAATVAFAENHGLDIEQLLSRARARGTGLLDAVGDTLLARGIGVTVDEYDAFGGFFEHFDVLDAAFGRADRRVSTEELEFVVAEPCFFTEAQVLAAEAMLANPILFSRLDTAHENDDIFGDGPDAADRGFGRIRPGDGVVSADDLTAFMLKSQLHRVLGDHADAIDIGDDPSGIVDGYRSEADYRAFLADPDLPEEVRRAAEVMLEAGWFDESWWQEHKDEIALGAALVAGGIVIVATSGTASSFVVGTVSAAAAGTTTIAINARTDDELLEDLFTNSVAGFMVGSGMASVASGVAAQRSGGHALARLHGVAEASAGATDVVMYGGLDALFPEEWEEAAKGAVRPVNTAATALDVGLGGVVDRLPRAQADAGGEIDF